MITAALQAEIEKYLKRKITSIAPLSAANNAHIYRLVLEDKMVCVAKVAEYGLDVESFMLTYLKKNSKLPVPTVYYSNEHVIIMDFIETHFSMNDVAQRHAADLLAGLHAITADTYGFESDTAIGSFRQPNPQTKDWPAFYAEHRLIHMAGEALKDGKVDKAFMQKVEKLAAKLPALLKGYNPPGLVHGDIWGGNVLAGSGRIAGFLDPAIYYADPEVELAFIKLFSTFGDSFFYRYNELRPIRAGFHEERADIYNVYPLIVHTRLFGASYARKAQKILDRFI